MPLAAKFRTLHDLKRNQETGRPYPLAEIAETASRLYREEKVSRTVEELRATGASMDEIERVCENIRNESDVVNRLYLTELRDGKKKDIKWSVVEALSLFFKVPTDFWRIGDAATEATRRAEEEVELIALGVKVAKAAEAISPATEGDAANTEGMELFGALLRGAEEKDPAQVGSILRLALMALEAAPDNQTG